jgi:RNA polymerase sigma-70 factor (ECF subfamily)
VRGRDEVAAVFRGRARAARAATIDGAAGAVWASDGRVHSAFLFSFEGDRIVAVDLVMERLDDLDVVFVDG